MMDFLDWLFTTLAPISGFLVYSIIAIVLVAIAFVVSFVLAKIETKKEAKE